MINSVKFDSTPSITPKEFFTFLTGDCGKYDVLQKLFDVCKNDTSEMLEFFLDDLETCRKNWSEEQYKITEKGLWDEYYEECNRIDSILMVHGNYNGDYPTEPLPFF